MTTCAQSAVGRVDSRTIRQRLIVFSVITFFLGVSHQAHAQPDGTVPDKKEPLFVLAGHVGEVFTVVFAPDGTRLASATNREVKVWDAATGKEVFSYPSKGTNVYGLAFSPDGKRLAVGISKLVKMLDAATGRELTTFSGSVHFLFRMSFSPDGKFLAASCGSTMNTGDVRIWDTATGKEVRCLQGHATAVLNLAYSADGRLLASASGGTMKTLPGEVKIWEAGTGRELLTLTGHAENVYGVAFSPDGRRLVSSSGIRGAARPGSVKLWEVATGKPAFDFVGHTGAVYNIVFSPDGRRLATASGDKTIKLWEVVSGQEVLSIPAHSSTVYSLSFSPDGRRLASAGQDRLVKIWDVANTPGSGAVRPAARTAEEMEGLWNDLANADAAKAYRSLGVLAAVQDLAMPFLEKRVRPAARLRPGQEKQVTRWLLDLDDEVFEVRETAVVELAKVGEAALPALRQTLSRTTSLEVRQRATGLIDSMSDTTLSPEQLAGIRAVEVLERIGTLKARTLLRTLADGLPNARLTREAQSSLDRLARHTRVP